MLDELSKQLTPVLLDALMALLLYGLGQITVWLRAHTQNVRVAGIIDRLDDAVANAVREVEQTVVKVVKAKGVMTPEARAVALQAALDQVKTHLGPKGIADLKKTLKSDDVDKVLVSRIEAKVHDVRAAQS